MIEMIEGDCLEVMKTYPDNYFDFILTDLPYGVSWQSNRRFDKHARIENDNNVLWVESAYKEMYRVLKPDSLLLTFYGWPEVDVFMQAWKKVGFLPKSHLVWVKNNMGLGWFTRAQHEPLFLLAKGKPPKPQHAISDVLTHPRTANEFHPTQKPLSLMRQLVQAYSKVGDTILDPFAGSGTTLRAAKDLNRNCVGIELNPKYFKVAEQTIGQEILL